MNPLATATALRRLLRDARLPPEDLAELRRRKLRWLVRHAYATVPYYRRLFSDAGVDPATVRDEADLACLPITTKADLQAAGEDAILSQAFERETLIAEHTSGSTGRPFTTYFDRRFHTIRDALFLRTLFTAGYRPGMRLLLVTSDRDKPAPPYLRWRYASIRAEPEVLAATARDFSPDIVYGCVTPLRRMAELLEHRPPARPPKVVVTTAETLSAETRRLIGRAFRCDVIDVFGLTEIGMLAFECPRHTGYHLSEDTAVVELGQGGTGEAQPLIVTNLELYAMPLIRYSAGDLAVPLPQAEACGCGRTLKRLQRLEGRAVDCLRPPGGGVVSPYSLTMALERVAGLGRYQIVQEDRQRVVVLYEGIETGSGPDAIAVRAALMPLLGTGIDLDLRRQPSLEPPPGRKFRVVENRWQGAAAS